MFTRRYIALLFVLLLGAIRFASAQEMEGVEYKIEGTDLYCYIDRDIESAQLDSLLGTCGIDFNQLLELQRSGALSPQYWSVSALSEEQIVLQKSMLKLKGKPQSQKEILSLFVGEEKSNAAHISFGYNDFIKPAVIELDNGFTRFFLKVQSNAQSVLLSGTFNEWSTSSHPMSPCDSGFFLDLKLADGAHLYKYIVNGYWILDPRNRVKEMDWAGNENSVYFKTNTEFKLEGNLAAKEVVLAGSFNDWNEQQYTLQKTPWGWQRKCFLKEGTHAYKYIVDGEWILDPGNKTVRSDGDGNENSFIAVGDTFYFYYPRHLEAEYVIVSGNFNDWNEEELKMSLSDSGWVLPYVLPAGNYEYKFRVAGQALWQLDPLNPISTGLEKHRNSVLCIKANQHFFYPHQAKADEVLLSGDFNGWQEHGYRMERASDGWHIDIYLPKGKTRYKFIADGKWIRDPSNPLFEPNEYDGYNSVLWRR